MFFFLLLRSTLILIGPSHTMPSMSNHPHEHHDLGSEFPEHYDLENASSIAPSDIDIVYHYKGKQT